jgi:hypothetical protein
MRRKGKREKVKIAEWLRSKVKLEIEVKTGKR